MHVPPSGEQPPRSAILTGGSSGIGKAVASLLVAQGWTVTLIARRPDVLASARAELLAHASKATVHTIAADVSKRDEANAAMTKSIELAGVPELLVASAGIATPGYFDTVPVTVHEETLAINYLGTLYCVLAVWPGMKAAGRGSIAMISSGAGLSGIFGYTAYAPSKFAVRGLAESLRPEAKRHGIHVAVVYPPDTDTPQHEAESKIKPVETKAIVGNARLLSAEHVAKAIVRGIARRQFAITPGLEMTLLNRLHSLIAPLLWRWFDHVADGARRN